MTYNEFISNIINTRGQWAIAPDRCYEAHHIIPRCLGGLPKNSSHNSKHKNIIWLYPHEHFIAHKLLAEENKDNDQLISAFWRMATAQNNKMVTPEEYEQARILYINSMSGKNNSFYGKHHSEETRKLISIKTSKAQLGRQGTNTIKVICINTGTIFNSAKEAMQKLKVGRGLYDCIRGQTDCAYGYAFSKIDDLDRIARLSIYRNKPRYFIVKKYPKNNFNKKQVLCIENNAIYESASDVGRQLNIAIPLIVNCLNGKHKTTHGYSFKYIQRGD